MPPLARLAAALVDPQPKLALSQALAIAGELGITPGGSDQAAWRTLSCEGQTLTLVLSGAPPADAALYGDLLQALFARAISHEQLLRVQERSELFSAASFEGLFFHVDGDVIDVNQRLLELSGYQRSDLLGAKALQRCIAPEDVAIVQGRMADRYEGEYVITAVRKDGSRFRAELQAKQGKRGEHPVRVVAVRDVTERERAQSLLRETEVRLRNLAETTFDLTVFTCKGVVIDVVGIESALGYTREQVIGRNVIDFTPDSAKPEVLEAHTTQRTGSYETLVLAANGEEVPIEAVAVNTTLKGEPVRMTAMRDLREAKRQQRERRDLERAFEQSQRLESLGVLAGGIAHDFNNLLTVVLGHAEQLEARLSARDELRLVRGIADAAQRAAGLTSQMLAYAGRSELGPRTAIDVGALVQELRSLLDAGLSKRAHITLSLTEHGVVLGNRATLTQVIMNLLTNASDALAGEPGTIGVRTSRLSEPDARWSRALGNEVRAGHWLLLEVQDTGVGMDEATQARVFEPFFSTKTKGHGLGLAACVGIVASHGGAILVESQPGQGSTFSVLLPSYTKQTPARSEPAVAHRVEARSVLVVDDEPVVRANLCSVLALQGYRVEEAENGGRALELLKAYEPSVVLLDMTMPDLSGVEVLRRIRESGSRVPVVFSSGYHDAAIDLDESSFQGFLVKPYRMQELYAVLERAILGSLTELPCSTAPELDLSGAPRALP